MFKRRNISLRIMAIGSTASITFAFLLGFILTPTSVQWREEGAQVAPIPFAAYWFNVVGITIWFSILGVIASGLLAVLTMWWKRGQG